MADDIVDSDVGSQATVQLYAEQQVVQTTTATLKHWTKGAAARKGFFALLVTWLLALAALPIPIVHFVAVPLLLCIGPIIGFVLYKTHVGRTDVRVDSKSALHCSKCSQTLSVDSGIESWPRLERCPSCGTSFEVKLLR